MSKETIDHSSLVKTMTWEELADTIIDLELELAEFQPFMNKSTIKKYKKVIKVYEDEKESRVNHNTFSSDYFDFTYLD